MSHKEGPARFNNVLVLGGSYAGCRAAEVLADKLPSNYRVILIDKRSHFYHLYKAGRQAVTDKNSERIFVPYTNLLDNAPVVSKYSCPRIRAGTSNHVVVNAAVRRITSSYVEVDQDLCEIDGVTESPVPLGESQNAAGKNPKRHANVTGSRVPYRYLVYALGSHLPPPIASPALTKKEGLDFLREQQQTISRATSILIIGAGALGIQYATDIKDQYPDKKVTIIHSRDRLLPAFDVLLHEESVRRFEELGVEYILGDRVILLGKRQSIGWDTIRTEKGRELTSDLRIFATGQRPNTEIMKQFIPDCIDDQGFIKVKRSLQVIDPRFPRVFAVGDCIDGFGAIKAGHTGWNQANIAVENIIKLIQAESEPSASQTELTEYHRSLPMIRLTLGLTRMVSQLVNPNDPTQLELAVHDVPEEDDSWQHIWKSMKHPTEDPTL